MVCGITKQMHQRISDLVYYGTIQFGLFTTHIQFHLLVQLLGQITDHSGELHNNALNRYHSYLHYRFMKVRGYVFQILDLLIECGIIALVIAGRSYQRVLGNDQLTYQIHQGIQFFNIYTHGTVDDRLIGGFLFRCLGCGYRLLFFLLGLFCSLDLCHCFLLLFCGFDCFLFRMVILGLLQFQYRTGYLCDLRYALCGLDNIIQRVIRQNDQCEVLVELLILYILCAGHGYDDLTFFLHGLEYQECSCGLQDTAFLYHYIDAVYIFTLLHSLFDHTDLAVIKSNVIPFFTTVCAGFSCRGCGSLFLGSGSLLRLAIV